MRIRLKDIEPVTDFIKAGKKRIFEDPRCPKCSHATRIFAEHNGAREDCRNCGFSYIRVINPTNR